MNFETVEKELTLAKEEYYNIYGADFNPVSNKI